MTDLPSTFRLSVASDREIEGSPSILVSFPYLQFLPPIDNLFRDWALDSGAFSAKNSGKETDLGGYIEKALELKSKDKRLVQIFSLDEIGDHKKTLLNTVKMWEAGVEATPTFHEGEPWSALEEMTKEFDKIALGGAVGKTGRATRVGQKLAWAEECFRRVWPKRIHGFGFGSRRNFLTLPWWSVDTSTWDSGPTRFGWWNAFPKKMKRCETNSRKAEIEFYLRLEREHRTRFAATFRAAGLG